MRRSGLGFRPHSQAANQGEIGPFPKTRRLPRVEVAPQRRSVHKIARQPPPGTDGCADSESAGVDNVDVSALFVAVQRLPRFARRRQSTGRCLHVGSDQIYGGRIVSMINVILIGESHFRPLGRPLRFGGQSRRACCAENTSHRVNLNGPKGNYFADRHSECDAA